MFHKFYQYFIDKLFGSKARKDKEIADSIARKDKEIADSIAHENQETLKIKIRQEIADEVVYKFNLLKIPAFITLPPDQEDIDLGDSRVRKICLRCLIIHKINLNDSLVNIVLNLTASQIRSSVKQQPNNRFYCPICTPNMHSTS